MKFNKNITWLVALLLVLCLAFSGCDLLSGSTPTDEIENSSAPATSSPIEQRAAEKALGVAAFSGKPYAELNGNKPKFEDDEITDKSYEFYSELDSLGRCGYAMASIGRDIMPTEYREGSLSSVTPSGWKNKKYSTELVEGGYIYNRAHLIAWQLTAETTNKQNLITGTRYMNTQGMLPFENMVADYIKETENHVMYRVTPVYDQNDLVACGVIMEAYSVEDNGEGISFNVYIYNVQPGIIVDYSNGNSWLSGETPATDATESTEKETNNVNEEKTYIINKSNGKFHLPTCSGVKTMSEANKEERTCSAQSLIDEGYTACGTCKPAN